MTTTRVLKLQRSIMVRASIRVPGDVSRETLESDVEEGADAQVTTKRVRVTINNPEEYERAQLLADKLRAKARSIGASLESGLIMVPLDREQALDEFAEQARAEAAAFNETSQNHLVRVAITKLIPLGGEEAVARGVALQMQEHVNKLTRTLETYNVDKIRNVAAEAMEFAKYIPEGESDILRDAIKSARGVANFINREVKKKERDIEEVRAEITAEMTSPLDTARAKFLELAVPVEIEAARAGTTEHERFNGLSDEAAPIATPAADASHFAELE